MDEPPDNVDVAETEALGGPVDEEFSGTRRRGTVLWVVVPVAIVLAAFVVLLTVGLGDGETPTETALQGQVAPPIVAEDLAGEPYDLDRFRGQWVVVNFFATWCPPCVQEHPELISFEAQHRATGDAAVVSVVFGDEPDNVRQFFADNGGDWPVITDEDGSISVDFGVISVPETYLVAPNGRVATRLLGGITAETLNNRLAAFDAEIRTGS